MMIVPSEPISPAAVARHYDDLDVFYREVWGEHVHHGLWRGRTDTVETAVVSLAEHVAQAAQIAPDHHVCDVGSGYGATARLLARRFGARVTALTVTPSQKAFADSVEPGATNPRYLLGNWLENDFSDRTFDVVIAIESTEHMPEARGFFQEAARTLKPGGRLVVCAWLAREQPRPWQIRLLLQPICREGRLAGLGTETEYRRMLESAGFHLERFEDLSGAVARTWTICARRFLGGLWGKPAYRRFLLDARNPNRVFALTLFRIRLAYALGVMRYGVFTARKGEGDAAME